MRNLAATLTLQAYAAIMCGDARAGDVRFRGLTKMYGNGGQLALPLNDTAGDTRTGRAVTQLQAAHVKDGLPANFIDTIGAPHA